MEEAVRLPELKAPQVMEFVPQLIVPAALIDPAESSPVREVVPETEREVKDKFVPEPGI
jgi:hypothetical protein